MGHGAASLDTEQLVRNGTGRTVAAANIGSTGTQHSSISTLCAARTKFQNGSALGRADNAVGLGCNQALVVDGQQ